MFAIRFPALLLLVSLFTASLPLAQDQLTKQALKKIDSVEADAKQLKEDDSATAKKLLGDLAWAGRRLNAVYDKTDEHYVAAVKRYEALREKLQKIADKKAPAKQSTGYDFAKLQQLNKEVGNGYNNLRLLNKSFMGDSFRVNSIKKELKGLKERLATFPADDANVKVVAGNLKQFDDLFNQWHSEYQADLARSGDVKTRLDQVEAKYKSENVPDRLQPPYEVEGVRAWAQLVSRFQKVEIPNDHAWLASLRGMGGINPQRQSRLQNWVGSEWPRRLDNAVKEIRMLVEGQIRTTLSTAKWLRETDPNDQNQIINRVLGEGTFDQNMKVLQDGLHSVAVGRALDEGLGAPPTVNRDAQQKELEDSVTHLRELAVQALDQVRMPAAKSTDKKLLEAAEETLKRKSYKVNPWKRLVINYDVHRKEKHEGTITPGSVHATITMYHYVWDEYQVATAEKVGDEYWIYFNTLKFFHKGAPSTPTGRWVLSGRFQSTRILEEHIDK